MYDSVCSSGPKGTRRNEHTDSHAPDTCACSRVTHASTRTTSAIASIVDLSHKVRTIFRKDAASPLPVSGVPRPVKRLVLPSESLLCCKQGILWTPRRRLCHPPLEATSPPREAIDVP